MAYPVHPNRGDDDLNFSVLYDGFTAEGVILDIGALDATSPFPDAPESEFSCIVSYVADEHGQLNGKTLEWVPLGGTPQAIPTPFSTLRGWEFDYWALDGQEVDLSEYIVDKDVEFTAVFKDVGERYTITFNAGEYGHFEENGEITLQVVYREGDQVIFPDVVQDNEEDYIFTVWHAPDGKMVETDSVTAESDITYTAQWQYVPKNYTITFEVDGGHGTINRTQVVVGENGKVSFPTATPDYGYELDGWYDELGRKLTSTNNITATADVTYKVKFKEKYYTITFNTDGNGSVTPTTTQVQEGQQITFPEVTPNNGYEFAA